MQTESRENFSKSFFDLISILDGKELSEDKNYLAVRQVLKGNYLTKENFLKRMDQFSIEDQSYELDNWYCLKKENQEEVYIPIHFLEMVSF